MCSYLSQLIRCTANHFSPSASQCLDTIFSCSFVIGALVLKLHIMCKPQLRATAQGHKSVNVWSATGGSSLAHQMCQFGRGHDCTIISWQTSRGCRGGLRDNRVMGPLWSWSGECTAHLVLRLLLLSARGRHVGQVIVLWFHVGTGLLL